MEWPYNSIVYKDNSIIIDHYNQHFLFEFFMDGTYTICSKQSEYKDNLRFWKLGDNKRIHWRYALKDSWSSDFWSGNASAETEKAFFSIIKDWTLFEKELENLFVISETNICGGE